MKSEADAHAAKVKATAEAHAAKVKAEADDHAKRVTTDASAKVNAAEAHLELLNSHRDDSRAQLADLHQRLAHVLDGVSIDSHA